MGEGKGRSLEKGERVGRGKRESGGKKRDKREKEREKERKPFPAAFLLIPNWSSSSVISSKGQTNPFRGQSLKCNPPENKRKKVKEDNRLQGLFVRAVWLPLALT